jgi:hypothetical protein
MAVGQVFLRDFPQRPVRGRGSNTQSLHIDMINMKKIPVRPILRA